MNNLINTQVQYRPPALKYNGVTIIVSHVSRFDYKTYIGGGGGKILDTALASIPASRYACDIRVLSDRRPLIEGTKVVLLCGAPCLLTIGQDPSQLSMLRGYTFTLGNLVYIPTFFPQDCADIIDYEKSLNPNSPNYDPQAEEDSEGGEDDEGSSKSKGKTRRVNYKFWFTEDIRKAFRVVRSGFQKNRPPVVKSIPTIKDLQDVSFQETIYFDIESNPETQQITCLSVGDKNVIYSIPISWYLGGKYTLWYTKEETALIFRWLAHIFNHHTIVLHNAQFDLFVLLWRYKLPPPPQSKIEDTMIMHHRLYPEVEKSLGHCVGLYTDEGYHKNTAGTWTPSSRAEMEQLLMYNAKDVETTGLIHTAILKRAEKVEGALASFKQANACIRPYMLLTYRGLKLNNDALCKHIDETERRITFFEDKVLPLLVGHPINPRSPKQVASYLYDELGIKRGATGDTGEKTLIKILLKRNIPAVKLIIILRGLSKEVGQLRFVQWQDGRVTCSYILTGTDTFRLGSRSLLGAFGTNLQNWSKSIRKFVVAG